MSLTETKLLQKSFSIRNDTVFEHELNKIHLTDLCLESTAIKYSKIDMKSYKDFHVKRKLVSFSFE